MRIFDKIEEILAAACLIVMTILTFANVVARYLFSASFSFSEEITTYLFVLLSMLGTAIAAKRRAHLGLSIVTDAVGPRAEKALKIIGYFVAVLAGMDFRILCSHWRILCHNTFYTGFNRRD